MLGADTLGRSLLARLVVGAQNTLGIALAPSSARSLIGGLLGLVAGYSRGIASAIILRGADIVMSFPSLLLALIVLFSLGPSITNLVIVLAITRVPIYLRTTRAEVLEVRERMFVSAAMALGAGHAAFSSGISRRSSYRRSSPSAPSTSRRWFWRNPR